MTGVFDIVKMIVTSALVGGLIGLEREKKKTVLAGSRTFMLVSVYGTFAYLIETEFPVKGFISASFIGISLIAVLLGFIKNYKLGDIGITTSVAFITAFALGLFVGRGMVAESLAASVIISIILASKYYLHRFTEHLTHEELINALEFGVIAFVLYPIVPDHPIDPFGVLNPRVLLLLVIVVSTIGLFGFIALRWMAPEKGLPLIGTLGSLVSSKVVITTLSTKAGLDSRLTKPVTSGIVLSNIVMILRNLVIVGVLSFDMLKFMLLPLLTMVFVGIAYLRFQPGKERDDTLERDLNLSSPFAIIPAVKFALLFLGISLVVQYVQVLGVGGVYLAITLGSIVSSSAVIASLVSMYTIGSLPLITAASAGVIASIASLLVNLLITRVSGTQKLAKKVARPIIAMVLVGQILLIAQVI
ncbi:MAG TPA: DUF4010 domain-containing protein [Euryarchaeota archaeon]|nr:MgtC family protein [archaeon BMS3Bbin16]HDH28961.1 DUF4010 domain-containing protein [Euryarchaeota archaeon]